MDQLSCVAGFVLPSETPAKQAQSRQTHGPSITIFKIIIYTLILTYEDDQGEGSEIVQLWK